MLYVPILKAKKGEFEGVVNLTEEVKNEIVPLFEVVPDKVATFNSDDLNIYWKERPFFFDFSPELDWSENYNEVFKVYESINQSKAIPTVTVDYPDEYISRINREYSQVLLRFRLQDLQIEDFTARLKEVSNLLNDTQHFLMIDLQEIDETKITLLSLSIKSVVEAVSKHFNTESLIIASNSFPPQLSSKKLEFYKLDRLEHKLWVSLKNQIDATIIYSDYTINNWSFSEYIPGMRVSFNIRYTLAEEYLIFKGYIMTKKGFQMENVQPACAQLIEMPEYSGQGFSWGDNEIYQKAKEHTDKGGSPTTWRSIGHNHHIALIVDLLSNQS